MKSMISKKLFGTLSDGRDVDIYELKNANGVSASVIHHTAQPAVRFLRPTEMAISRMFSSDLTISRVMSSARTIRVKLSADMLIASAVDILPLTAKKLML